MINTWDYKFDLRWGSQSKSSSNLKNEDRNIKAFDKIHLDKALFDVVVPHDIDNSIEDPLLSQLPDICLFYMSNGMLKKSISQIRIPCHSAKLLEVKPHWE